VKPRLEIVPPLHRKVLEEPTLWISSRTYAVHFARIEPAPIWPGEIFTQVTSDEVFSLFERLKSIGPKKEFE
jgi:hypothetical protein